MRFLPIGIALTVVLALTSCAGPQSYSSATDVAQAIGCDTIEPVANAELQYTVDEQVDCTNGDETIIVSWFKSSDSFEAYKSVIDTLDGLGSPVVAGDRWAAECDERETCKNIKDSLGGDLSD